MDNNKRNMTQLIRNSFPTKVETNNADHCLSLQYLLKIKNLSNSFDMTNAHDDSDIRCTYLNKISAFENNFSVYSFTES